MRGNMVSNASAIITGVRGCIRSNECSTRALECAFWSAVIYYRFGSGNLLHDLRPAMMVLQNLINRVPSRTNLFVRETPEFREGTDKLREIACPWHPTLRIIKFCKTINAALHNHF
jgi:hypothetical protein